MIGWVVVEVLVEVLAEVRADHGVADMRPAAIDQSERSISATIPEMRCRQVGTFI